MGTTRAEKHIAQCILHQVHLEWASSKKVRNLWQDVIMNETTENQLNVVTTELSTQRRSTRGGINTPEALAWYSACGPQKNDTLDTM